jgi:hypothetical protein
MSEYLQIGDMLWCNDGRSHTRPWFECEITGETRQSWLCGYRGMYKVNKKTMFENLGDMGSRRWYVPTAMYVEKWLRQHPREIAKLVEKCRDVEVLMHISTLIGYVAEDPAPPVHANQGAGR